MTENGKQSTLAQGTQPTWAASVRVSTVQQELHSVDKVVLHLFL